MTDIEQDGTELVGDADFLDKRSVYCRNNCNFVLVPHQTVVKRADDSSLEIQEVCKYLVLCKACGFVDPLELNTDLVDAVEESGT